MTEPISGERKTVQVHTRPPYIPLMSQTELRRG